MTFTMSALCVLADERLVGTTISAEPAVNELKVGQEWHCKAHDDPFGKDGHWRIDSIHGSLVHCANLRTGGTSKIELKLWNDRQYRWTLMTDECVYPERVERSLCAECDATFVGLDYLCQSCR